MASTPIVRATPRAQYLAERAALSIAKRTATCSHCQTVFVAHSLDRLKFCSRQCAGAAKAKAKRPKACRMCVECGSAPVLSRARFCQGCRKSRASEADRTRSRARKVVSIKSCAECAAPFAAAYGDKRRRYCTKQCSTKALRRVTRAKERARMKVAKVERVDPNRVFERDGWRCQVCRVRTPKTLRGSYHPSAPELDHIHALAKGGEHSYRNTQLLCRSCNAAKSDGDIGQQMRLFG